MTRFVCLLAFVRVATQCLFVGQFSLFSEEGVTDFSLNYQLLKRFCSYQWIQTAVLRGAERQCREPGCGGSTWVTGVCQCSRVHLNKISPEERSPSWRTLIQISELLTGVPCPEKSSVDFYFHSRRTPVQTCCRLHTRDRSHQPLWLALLHSVKMKPTDQLCCVPLVPALDR